MLLQILPSNICSSTNILKLSNCRKSGNASLEPNYFYQMVIGQLFHLIAGKKICSVCMVWCSNCRWWLKCVIISGASNSSITAHRMFDNRPSRSPKTDREYISEYQHCWFNSIMKHLKTWTWVKVMRRRRNNKYVVIIIKCTNIFFFLNIIDKYKLPFKYVPEVIQLLLSVFV